jgi:hypothetical protein
VESGLSFVTFTSCVICNKAWIILGCGFLKGGCLYLSYRLGDSMQSYLYIPSTELLFQTGKECRLSKKKVADMEQIEMRGP